MRWIEFSQSVQFESEGRNKGPKFEMGERHHLEDGFADRWLRRGVAFAVDGPSSPPVIQEPQPVEPKASPSNPLRPKSRGLQAQPDA